MDRWDLNRAHIKNCGRLMHGGDHSFDNLYLLQALLENHPKQYLVNHFFSLLTTVVYSEKKWLTRRVKAKLHAGPGKLSF